MSKIKKVWARQILDSRGNPTLETEIHTESGYVGMAAVPSGASTGSKEALELRDGDAKVYLGKSVLQAVAHVNQVIGPKLLGQSVFDQTKIDQMMLELDGTEFKSKLGANAILSVSMSCARAAALEKKMELCVYLREVLAAPHGLFPEFQSDYLFPSPLMNIINGGAHASNNLDIQEFMIVPHLKANFARNLQAGAEVFHHLKKVLSKKDFSTNVGDEGGFAPNFSSHTEAIETILVAIKEAGYEAGRDISISLDCAASEFYKNGVYHFEGKDLSSEQMIAYYQELKNKYPIYSIEDGLDESDHQGWKKLTEVLGQKVVLVGDDLFVTNPKILQEGINNREANAILIKVNQIGTLTETFRAIELAYQSNYKAIISHRSGETGDSFIADLALATNAGHIKTGSASRSDRIEKYNQLLRLEERLENKARFKPIA